MSSLLVRINRRKSQASALPANVLATQVQPAWLDRKSDVTVVHGRLGLLTENSAIVELLIQKGFRVRGVGRSAARAALFKEKLESNYGKGTFEFAEVADQTTESAFELALSGK